ncbi:hypothetical protein [Nocardioides massiliensis]|uniref:YfhO family protein n=1 Tax=Nocardioides massiliensis TaxID=1325935 RepID=A0ABT9NT51_9ACTN|nr:hypothetical protein [Nocardioides massiliensis]MDP9823457.1 hypothetical protein [Nocardioides massiliensis]
MRLAAAWATCLSVLLLWPALGPGYVLTYDMVWVPDLRVGADALGLGTALPRAVPSDAVVGVLDEVVPGTVLQKLVLLGALVGGAVGAARLVDRLGTAGRLVAVTFWIWNPFVVERLAMGHWPVLVGYAVLPWLVVHAGRVTTAVSGDHASRRSLLALGVLLPVGSLSASAGIASAVVVLAAGAGRSARRTLVLLGLVACANAPWVVSGLAHHADATSGTSNADLFALAGEGGLPAPLTALGLGGVWNSEVVPASRESVLAWVALVVLLALAALGARSWWRQEEGRRRWALVAVWAVGWSLAVLTWAAPDLLGHLAASVPGVGLLRDGSRLLGLCVPLATVLVAHGVTRLLSPELAPVPRVVLAAGLVVHPVALLPDAALGLSGRLDAVSYPPEYADLRRAVGDARGTDVVLLPFSAFRAPDWNDGRTVLDPLPRYLHPDAVTNDELIVAGTTIPGEDPRAREVAAALAAPTPAERSAGLAEAGVGVAVVDRTAPGPVPELAGEVVHDGRWAAAIRLPGPVTEPPRGDGGAAVVVAWAAYVGLLAVGATGWVVGTVRRRMRDSAR